MGGAPIMVSLRGVRRTIFRDRVVGGLLDGIRLQRQVMGIASR